MTGKRPPIITLASKISKTARSSWSSIPDLPAPPCRSVSGKGQSGDVLFSQLLRKLSVIYCTSIRQQERSYFRHLKLLMSLIKECSHRYSACLHTTSTRCQNRSTPCCCNVSMSLLTLQSYKKIIYTQLYDKK